MLEKTDAADATADQDSSGATNEGQATDQLDYDKEFDEQVEKFERAEKNREGYKQRKATEEAVVADQTEEQLQKMEKLFEEKVLPKFIPKLQSSLAEDSVESELNRLAPGNEAKQKLIRFHFENSVAPNGTIKERMENALLIADKKTILKAQKEMAVALQNRQGLSASGLGTSTDGQTVKDNFFSDEQLKALKGRGFDDKKIERLKTNLRKLKS